MSAAPIITYRNTDLCLLAPISLEPLAVELRRQHVTCYVTPCPDGQFHVICMTTSAAKPEANIVRMLDAIESLPATTHELWSACTIREFNVGYDCGDEPWGFNNRLSNATLTRMARCGADLRITLYPFRADPEQGATRTTESAEINVARDA